MFFRLLLLKYYHIIILKKEFTVYYEENFQCDIDINQMDAVSVVYLSEDGRGFPSHSQSY